MCKLILFLLTSFSLFACTMNEKNKKYAYVVSDSAPRNFPCQIYRGSLHYGKTKGVPVPRGKFVANGWGKGGTTYGSPNPKEIPHQLDIIWLSYRENKFYGGSFKLPKEKMEALFEQGFIDIGTKNTKDTYNEIIVGVAPGGIATVWLMGAGHQVQVGIFKGEETEVNWEDFNPDGTKDRNKYINISLNEDYTPEELAKPIPFGLWETYATKYNWKPVIKGQELSFVFQSLTEFYSGETEMHVGEEAKKIVTRNSAVPKTQEIWWQSTSGKRYITVINFDEQEIFSAFQNVVKDKINDKVFLQFIYSSKKEVHVFLNTEKDKIQLNKIEIEIYKSSF